VIRPIPRSSGHFRHRSLLPRDRLHYAHDSFLVELILARLSIQVHLFVLASLIYSLLFTVKPRLVQLAKVAFPNLSYKRVPLLPALHPFPNEFLCILYRP
jgi:hypothetical protein